jgi:hypothetical protein
MFEEQKSVCTVCGHSHKLTAHHKIRQSDGGPNVRHNLVGVCRSCHNQIHGSGRGCLDHCGFPDYTMAALASQAHWDIVMEQWFTKDWLDHQNFKQERRHWMEQGAEDHLSHFGHLLIEAMQSTESVCT